ncbi:hypothetical protein M3C74_02100 [Micrococcus lylae]|uniref:hypothetical protein n=1 Tax=Micrococcus lylae TaxID=1273 RepID=UPI0021A590D9|nr:hypothetical protein [Micrococcus lylae]MCT2070637.1 hypothetical protein [Micrococcus lylae]
MNERGITVALEPNGVEIAVLLLWAVGLVCAVARLRRERSVSSWTVLVLAAVVPVVGSLVAIGGLFLPQRRTAGRSPADAT